MLAVIDNEVRVLELHFQLPEGAARLNRLEICLVLIGSGNGRKQVTIFVIQDVFRDIRHPFLVQDSLFAILGGELGPIAKCEHLGDGVQLHQAGVVGSLPDLAFHGRECYFHFLSPSSSIPRCRAKRAQVGFGELRSS